MLTSYDDVAYIGFILRHRSAAGAYHGTRETGASIAMLASVTLLAPPKGVGTMIKRVIFVLVMLSAPALADSGVSTGLQSMFGSPPHTYTITPAGCQAKRDRLMVYPALPWFQGDVFVWTTDAATMAMLSPLCRSGGTFNIYARASGTWEAVVWPQ